jgi:hypothetical protein
VVNRIAGLVLLFVATLSLQAQPAAEYRIKAAFLFNFTQFVEWPAAAFANADAPFVLCIAGTDPFGSALDDLVAGESAGAHRIVVRRLRDAADVSPCHLLFVSRSLQKDAKEILHRVAASTSVLTVSDIDRFVAQGGVIGLIVDEKRIRFEVGVRAAQQQRLKLSSQLLSLGRIVDLGSAEQG